jgi:hypothetical protein
VRIDIELDSVDVNECDDSPPTIPTDYWNPIQFYGGHLCRNDTTKVQ